MAKWNKRNQHVFASTNDSGEVRVWDTRTERYLCFIPAHRFKVSCLDWSPCHDNLLLTGSQEKAVRFWNTEQPKECVASLSTPGPVLRARFTPFGSGVAVVTQGSMTAGIWSLADFTSAVHTFKGHTSNICAIDWRSPDAVATPGSGSGGAASTSATCKRPWWELITSSKDRTLRAWRVPYSVVGALDAEVGIESVGAKGRPDDVGSSPGSRDSAWLAQPESLEKEFSAIEKHKPPSIQLHEMDRVNRTATLSCFSSSKTNAPPLCVRLKIAFPSLYPHGALPSFDFLTQENVQQNIRILKGLQKTAESYVSRNAPCFAECLYQLIEIVNTEALASASAQGTIGYDCSSTLPSPRTTGVAYGPRGTVAFFFTQKSTSSRAMDAPRTYAQLLAQLRAPVSKFPVSTATPGRAVPESPTAVATSPQSSTPGGSFAGNTTPSFLMATSFLYPAKTTADLSHSPLGGVLSGTGDAGTRGTSKGRGKAVAASGKAAPPSVASLVYTQDFSSLSPVCPQLAKLYSVAGTDATSLCQHNLEAARKCGRQDLVKLWEILRILTLPLGKNSGEGDLKGRHQHGIPWGYNPMGRQFLAEIFRHYQRLGDVQTLAVVSCVLMLYDHPCALHVKWPQPPPPAQASASPPPPPSPLSVVAVSPPPSSPGPLTVNIPPPSREITPGVQPAAPSQPVSPTAAQLKMPTLPQSMPANPGPTMQASSPSATSTFLRRSPLVISPALSQSQTVVTMSQMAAQQAQAAPAGGGASGMSKSGQLPAAHGRTVSLQGSQRQRSDTSVSSSSQQQQQQQRELCVSRDVSPSRSVSPVVPCGGPSNPEGILQPLSAAELNRHREAYAQLLHRWGLYVEQGLVLQFLEPAPHAFCPYVRGATSRSARPRAPAAAGWSRTAACAG
eukprot:m51a1_g12573 hypothetical protein (900) ;mRNA; r:31-3546